MAGLRATMQNCSCPYQYLGCLKFIENQITQPTAMLQLHALMNNALVLTEVLIDDQVQLHKP